jgi:hypothetical protein
MEYIFIFGALILIGVVIMSAVNKGKAKDAAQYAYQEALNDLKKHPTDPNKKQHALTLGRTYSNLTRNKQGVTIFDEMALMNDLNAATAGAPHTAQAVSAYAPAPSSATSPADRLRKLDDLKAQGLINDEEHAARRAKILEDL